MTEPTGIVYIMVLGYLAGEVLGWTAVRLMHRLVRRGRS